MKSFMQRLTLLLLIAADAAAASEQDVPAWVVHGIAMVETRSYYDSMRHIWRYVDTRVGADGERGVWQMTEVAFNEDAKPGERFTDLSSDWTLGERLLRRRLSRLYAKHCDWFIVAGLWNAGSVSRYGRLWRYAKRVKLAAIKLNLNQE